MSEIRFRQSTIATWMRCPLQAKFAHISNLPRRQNGKASFGTVVHHALELFNQTNDVDAAVEDFQYYWHNPEKLGVEPDYWPKYTTYGGLREDGIRIVQDYADKLKWENRTVIATEHPFLVPFGDHELSGTVDLIEMRKNHRGNDILRVLDYKELDSDTLVLTPEGWSKLRDVHVGDRVVGSNGLATEVTGEADKGVLPAWRLTFTDGTSVVCSEDHRWQVTDLYGVTRVLAVKDFKSLRKRQNHRYFIPTVAPVEFVGSSALPIPPYSMGVLLADGNLQGSVSVSRPDTQVRDRVSAEFVEGLRVVQQDDVTWRIIHGSGKRHPYIEALRAMGLWETRSWERFIPECYLRASTADRVALLSGLMDCDGGSSTRTDYRTTSPLLRDGVIELCRSLGGVPTTTTVEAYQVINGVRKPARECHIVVPRMPFNPFSLDRKAATWCPPQERQNRWITSVEQVEDREMRCIKVDADDGLYVVDGYVLTHNTNTRKPTKGELAVNIQFTVYTYATLQREFWTGIEGDPEHPGLFNGEFMYGALQDVPRRGIWYHLWTGSEIDAGTRVDSDFMRLYRVCEEIARAVELDVYVPNISGESCTICDFANGPCPVEIPERSERAKEEDAWL